MPVSSATYKDAYIKKLQAQGIPSGKATKVVNCVITGIEAKGIKTVGEILQHKDQFTTVANECQKKTGIA